MELKIALKQTYLETRVIRDLSITIMFAYPIFWKESLEASASSELRNCVIRIIYIGVLCLIVLAQWPWSSYGNFALRPNFGQTVISWVSWLHFILAVIICPILFGGSISSEKERGSFDLLLITRLRDSEIVLGKFFSKLFIVELIFVCALPILFLILDIGGISLRDLLASCAVIASMVLLCGAMGIFFAIAVKRLYAAVLWSYLALTIIFSAPYLVKTGYLEYVSPMLMLNTVLQMNMASDAILSRALAISISASLVISIVLLIASAHLLKGVVNRDTIVLDSMFRRLSSWKQRFREFIDNRFPNVGRFAALSQISQESHPVAWRETYAINSLNIGAPSNYSLMHVACLALIELAVVYHVILARSMPGKWLHLIYLTIAFLMLIIMAATLSSLAFVREKEKASLDMLLATPLKPEEIVNGKIRGTFRLAIPLIVIFVIQCLLLAATQKLSWISVVIAAILTPICVHFYIVQGTYFSLGAKKTSIAMLQVTLATIGELCIGFCCWFSFMNPLVLMVMAASNIIEGVVAVIVICPISFFIYAWLARMLKRKMIRNFYVLTMQT